jgi:type I site-specific restriction-modification system R (restriction) subunit
MPAISPNKPYRVGRSRTGLGLFATQPIKKGAKIVRYFGPLLDSKKKKDDAIENKYLFELNNRWTIDGSVRKNIARYINHACKPNAESDVKPRKRKVVIRAIKNISPGEEINYDYGTDYFKAYLKPIGCKCDACEKKRKKQRAEARAERLRLKARAEKKALRKAEKQAAKAKEKLGEKLELKRKLNGKTVGVKMNGKHADGKQTNEKPTNGKPANGKPANGKHLNGDLSNGHGRSGVTDRKLTAAKSGVSMELRTPATVMGGEQQASV